ncbi:polyglutamine-repeat protein pqn-41 [Athalia rosae]|uniref:polyglutamine-repeat protein pqn-41 n=1 Tax=Athalia rosae TaxID=37344 RepID=UPI002034319A|nr:polyglutamine-repeat protein pqn-41 [Athalia rosae]
MWLLVLTGLLAVAAAGKENDPAKIAAVEKTTSAKADDLVLLEIDVKGPAKRSPISASAVYGASPSQFVIRHGDESQELTPEYLGLLQQYTQTTHQQPQPQQSQATAQRRPLPAYARQQQQLQQAYQNSRVPAVAPPRPRAQLHPQALAQAEAAAQIQAQIDAQSRAEALQAARLPPGHQAAGAYVDPKLGTFEQELLQLVSANQAQEFKLVAAQQGRPRYLDQQQSLAYQAQSAAYVPKGGQEALQLPEQYHVETTGGRYGHQQVAQPAAYQGDEVAVQYQSQTPRYQSNAAKPFRPSARYPEPQDHGHIVSLKQAEAQAIAQAQAEAQAQALAFQRISQASHNKHQQDALEQIRVNNEQHRQATALEESRVREEQQRQQTTALEQIRHGSQVSEAGQAHLIAQAEEQAHPRPVDREAQLKAQLKAQAHAEAAAARRAQEAAEYKAHADAILNLQAQQQAHVKAQEEAHKNALALERNQLRAQVHAQALANAQAEAIYRHQQQARAKAHSEAQAAARAQSEARKNDPEHTPVVQYLLPTSVPLPPPNSYFNSEEVQKYATSASSYVPRSAPKNAGASTEEQAYAQPPVNQPRQAYKYKNQAQSSIYVSQSGLAKKAPIKSLTIEEIIEQDQQNSPQVVRLPNLSGPQSLTQEDVAALISAGYSVTPVPSAKPAQRTSGYGDEAAGYYAKKQRSPTAARGGDYVSYDEIQSAVQQQRRPLRKQKIHQVQE